VLVRFGGRGKTSGLELGQVGATEATLLQVRGGKGTRLALYFDRNRALADLGLIAEADSTPPIELRARSGGNGRHGRGFKTLVSPPGARRRTRCPPPRMPEEASILTADQPNGSPEGGWPVQGASAEGCLSVRPPSE
jgi:hypothetical protein